MEVLKFEVDLDDVPALRAAGAIDKALGAMGQAANAAGASAASSMRSFNNAANAAIATLSGAAATASLTFGAIGGAVGLFGKSLLDSGSEMETLETQLRVLMGSAEAGTKRFQQLFDIGSSTPFETADLVAAEVTLRSLGANAEKALPMVMDFAGAMDADLQSAALDVGRAMQFGAGSVETLAGKALRAQVELRTGQDALKMSAAEFRKEVETTLTDPTGIFAGGTAKMATTWKGAMSNLSDEWTKFQRTINDSGFFAGMKALLMAMLAGFEANRKAINELATTIGRVLLDNVQRLIETIGAIHDGWYAFQLGVNAVGGLFSVATARVADMVGGIAEGVIGLAHMQEAITGISPEPILAAARAIAQNAAVIEGGAAKGVREAADESARLRAELGKGAEWASTINTQIDIAAQKARTFKVGDATGPEFKPSGEEAEAQATRERERLEKHLAEMTKAHTDAAAEIGFNAAEVRAIQFTRELNETAAQFDTLIAMREQAGMDVAQIELDKNATLAALGAEFMAEEAEVQADLLKEQMEERQKLEEEAAKNRLDILRDEADQRAQIMSTVNSFMTSQASAAANQLVQIEGDKSAAIKALSAGMFADLLDQLAKFFGVKAAASAATGNFVAAGLFAAGGVIAAAGAGVVRGLAAKNSGDSSEVFHQGGAGLMPGDRVQTGETMAVINRAATRDMGLDEVGLRQLNGRTIGSGGSGGGGAFRLRVGNAELDLIEELAAIDARGNGGFSRRSRAQQASNSMSPGNRGRM